MAEYYEARATGYTLDAILESKMVEEGAGGNYTYPPESRREFTVSRELPSTDPATIKEVSARANRQILEFAQGQDAIIGVTSRVVYPDGRTPDQRAALALADVGIANGRAAVERPRIGPRK